MKRSKDNEYLSDLFIDRWSPRALANEAIPDEHVTAIFAAARWAPSCFNEQPWEFVAAKTENHKNPLTDILVEANQVWAKQASILAIAFARKNFAKNGNPNALAMFDTGSAWMSLAFQAHHLGYVTHAMAGFDKRKAFEVAGRNSKEWEACCVIAIGRPGNANTLPEALKERETPSDRKPLTEVVHWIEPKFRS